MGPYSNHDLGIPYPYYGIKLTEEEKEQIKNLIPQIYITNGQTTFEFRKDGIVEGHMIYIVWLPTKIF